jgi:O-antigen ligase
VPRLIAAPAGPTLLALLRPVVAVMLALALVPLELFSVRVGVVDLSATEVMFVVAGVGWAARRLAQATLPISSSPLLAPMCLLVAAIVPGLLVSSEQLLVAKTLAMWTAFFLVFNAIVDQCSRREVEWLLMTIAVSAALVGALAVTTSGDVSLGAFGEEATGRAVGSFGHPNILAAFEILALPGALALSLRGPSVIRPFAALAGALCLMGLVLSLSRGGLLAGAAAAGVLLLWAPFRRLVALAAVVVGILLVSGLSALPDSPEVDVVAKRLSSVRYSAQGVNPRFQIWRTTPDIVADHPVFGVGANVFPEIAPAYGLISSRLGGAYEHAHNVPLTIAAELGLIGLAALVWLTFALARVLWRACRAAEPRTKALGFALTASLVAFAVQGLVDYILRVNVIAATLFVLCGCAVAVTRSPATDE